MQGGEAVGFNIVGLLFIPLVLTVFVWGIIALV